MGTNLRTVNVHRPVATFGSRAVHMACPSMGMQLWYVFLHPPTLLLGVRCEFVGCHLCDFTRICWFLACFRGCSACEAGPSQPSRTSPGGRAHPMYPRSLWGSVWAMPHFLSTVNDINLWGALWNPKPLMDPTRPRSGLPTPELGLLRGF